VTDMYKTMGEVQWAYLVSGCHLRATSIQEVRQGKVRVQTPAVSHLNNN